MQIAILAEAPPIRQDESGALRIEGSRVLVELIIRAFQDGATPETIAQRYSSVSLRDVYATVTYYLGHRQELDSYLANREREAEEIRQAIEERQGSMIGVRERLLARQQNKRD